MDLVDMGSLLLILVAIDCSLSTICTEVSVILLMEVLVYPTEPSVIRSSFPVELPRGSISCLEPLRGYSPIEWSILLSSSFSSSSSTGSRTLISGMLLRWLASRVSLGSWSLRSLNCSSSAALCFGVGSTTSSNSFPSSSSMSLELSVASSLLTCFSSFPTLSFLESGFSLWVVLLISSSSLRAYSSFFSSSSFSEDSSSSCCRCESI
mmetsp:Transcript_2907/g.2735  ORF Transcript_2907/g.2735 Transcript_2907/m.2735 type:complete len:208 (+) Transcript_2907:350-973(+)